MHEDYFVYFHNLPGKINETVTEGIDGYTVIIDPRQSQAGIERSYAHATGHAEGRDFEKDDVQEIEYDAHRKE